MDDVEAGGKRTAVQTGLGFEDGDCAAAYPDDANFLRAVGFEAEGGRFSPDFHTRFDRLVGDIGVLLDAGNRDGYCRTDILDKVSPVAGAGCDRFAEAGRYDGDGLVVILIQREVEKETVPSLYFVTTRNRIGCHAFYGGQGDGVVNGIGFRFRVGLRVGLRLIDISYDKRAETGDGDFHILIRQRQIVVCFGIHVGTAVRFEMDDRDIMIIFIYAIRIRNTNLYLVGRLNGGNGGFRLTGSAIESSRYLDQCHFHKNHLILINVNISLIGGGLRLFLYITLLRSGDLILHQAKL